MSSIHALPGLNSAFSFFPALLHPEKRPNKIHSDNIANNADHPHGFLRYIILSFLSGLTIDFPVHHQRQQ
jgi:hypothetical protein